MSIDVHVKLGIRLRRGAAEISFSKPRNLGRYRYDGNIAPLLKYGNTCRHDDETFRTRK